MTEILTESFCERCGTRYTFESSAPRKSRIGRVRTFSRGVRNFVLSDESSFSEAMAEARGEEELAATAHQLDAFHQTFNFCLTCRQYTCSNCWNPADGRCLTCAPMPGIEEAAPRSLVGLEATVLGGNGHAPEDAVEAWPEADLSLDRLARLLGGQEEGEAEAAEALPAMGPAADVAEVFAPAESIAQVEAHEPIAVAETAAAPEPAATTVDPETGPAAASAEPVRGVAPGQSLSDAIAAYEAMLAAEEADRPIEAVPEPTVAPEPGPAAAPEPLVAAEPQAIEPEHEPTVVAEPIAPPAVVAPAPTPLEPAAAAPGVDRVPQPTWPAPTTPAVTEPIAPPEPPRPSAPPPWLTVAPDTNAPEAEPQWPSATAIPGPSGHRGAPATLVGRPLLPQVDTSALWAASAREVLSGAPLGAAPLPAPAPTPTATAQPCVQCGLSLSANARFCRRCGARQG